MPFVEGLCAAFHAERLGRPSLRPGLLFGDRLLRGSVVGAGDCVAGRGFAEPAGFPGPGRDRGDAEPLEAVARRRLIDVENARGGVHVGAGTVGGSGSGAGEDGRRRCDDAGSERGDAEQRAEGYRGHLTKRSCVSWRRHRGLRRRRALRAPAAGGCSDAPEPVADRLGELLRVPTTFVQKYTPRAQLQALGCPRAGLRARETGGGGRPARFCQE